MIPNRSISYRLTAACIISTAQHAKPKVNGHKEPALDQLIKDSVFADIHSTFIKYNYLRKERRTCFENPLGRETP